MPVLSFNINIDFRKQKRENREQTALFRFQFSGFSFQFSVFSFLPETQVNSHTLLTHHRTKQRRQDHKHQQNDK